MKCGAGKANLFATPSCAPQGVLRGGGGPENHRRPLKPPLGRAVSCLNDKVKFPAHMPQ